MTLLPDPDLQALIRTLLGVQATIVAGSITVMIYLLSRWREARERNKTAMKAPKTAEAEVELRNQSVKLFQRSYRAKTFVVYVPLITVIETLVYFFQWLSSAYIVVGILGFYVLEILYLNWVVGPPSYKIRLERSEDD